MWAYDFVANHINTYRLFAMLLLYNV